MISLVPMSRELFHELNRGFEYDPMLFADMELFERAKRQTYDPAVTDKRFDDRMKRPGTITFAVMLEGSVIGEVLLKRIDRENRACELGIHLINDSVKGNGHGTEAERLAISYAFNELGLETVFADSIIKNVRSQHILEKLGFEFLREDDGFRYYKLDRVRFQ